jgi:signal transduction histidine kinase
MITLRLKRDTARLGGRARPVAVLAVADTGNGIPPGVQKRLFDPFFTTKEDGTGLGLAIAARIAEKHGGLLRYRTQLNRGTTFELVLPAVKEDATKNTAHRG